MELLEVYYTSLDIGGVDAEDLTVTYFGRNACSNPLFNVPSTQPNNVKRELWLQFSFFVCST